MSRNVEEIRLFHLGAIATRGAGMRATEQMVTVN
jgi:hypothetical protein